MRVHAPRLVYNPLTGGLQDASQYGSRSAGQRAQAGGQRFSGGEVMEEATICEKMLGWYLHGERGLSSEAIARAVVGVTDKRAHYPRDPGDLRRCLLLLREVPEAQAGISLLAKRSTEWARLRKAWPDLEAQLRAECGHDLPARGFASKTYALMKAALEGVTLRRKR